MRIQTVYMGFNNCWTISGRYDFQVHQQRSQWRCISYTALQWFEVLPGLSLPLPGALRVVGAIPRCSRACCRLTQTSHRRSQTCCRRSQVHIKFSLALNGVLKRITMTPMILLHQSSEISVTPKAARNVLLWCNTLLKLMHLCLHSTSCQTLRESSSD